MFKPILVCALAALSMPAFANGDTNTSSESKAKDPNRQVCQTIEETGSRLGRTRICQTAQQWEEQRRAQRADVERAQQNTGIQNGN
jgi:phage shock protein A